MFSQVSPRGPGFELSQGTADVASIPPPPPRPPSNGPATVRHGARPVPLNTTVSYVPGAGQLATPIVPPTPSALSSPFAFSNPNTTHAAAPGSTPQPPSRGVSPANHRLSGNFTMTYDPREWASGRQSVESRQRRDCYGEPLDTPPPPYSGSQEQRNSTSSALSHPTTTYTSPEASLTSTPVTQDTIISGDAPAYTRPKLAPLNTTSRQSHDLRRTTHMNSIAAQEYNPAQAYQQYRPQQSASGPSTSSLSFQANRRSSDGNTLPPPPPPRRPTPGAPSNPEASSSVGRLSYSARRSTSAGPTPVNVTGPSLSRPTRTISNESQPNNQEWAPGMRLPGPPSAPPPPSRSRSADGQNGALSDAGPARKRLPRLSLRNSQLTPIPATPSSVTSGTSSRPMPFPLRIDTGVASGLGKAPAVVRIVQPQDTESNGVAQPGTSALARRSAVRGPAARSSGPLRSRSKSISGRSEMNEPPSTTLSNNPWASALEQCRSPGDETLPESALLPSIRSTALEPSKGLEVSHTPPATPSLRTPKPPVDNNLPVQQAKVLPTPPLSQKPLLSANSVTSPQQLDHCLGQQDDEFVTQAMQRHIEFLRLEQEAATDLDRLMLFTQFMHQESLIRKNRYMDAFQSDDFSVEAAQHVLFNSSETKRASGGELEYSVVESPLVANTPSSARADNGWWKDYQPKLSPIASMDYDEMSSRGRAPSRWWESATGSQSDGRGPRVVRSKRESKYMSLSKKLLQDMEASDMDPVYENSVWPQGDQYPDEKVDPDTFGYYEEEKTPSFQQLSQRQMLRPSAIDISRFITLPPPYPRHYPAVNNSHPDLAEYRATVRMLGNLEDAKNRQARHKMSVDAMRQDRSNKISENRKQFKANIQAQIVDGSMSFADAADAEKLAKAAEHDIERQGLQAEFDTLQDVVINPLHDQFNERIERLSNSLQTLEKELFANAANQNPDQPVQEGDDVPELLEQLTQLKWLFEARETLHQELFDLLSQRNDAYKAIVALPYHQTNNVDKVRDTEAFFDKDTATRYAFFCAEALKRQELFLQFVEDNALRGIEMQSSAFWDITPGLVDILQKIPTDVERVEIQIPDNEMQENPAYREHPQQYLYSLLRHAEKSSYQYIEGQINLYCLVHEVKTGYLSAHYKASKAQQKMAGDQSLDIGDTRQEDEGELTDELKNRAAMIEEQWQDALGKYFEAVSERVKQQLQDCGAWDEIEIEA